MQDEDNVEHPNFANKAVSIITNYVRSSVVRTELLVAVLDLLRKEVKGERVLRDYVAWAIPCAPLYQDTWCRQLQRDVFDYHELKTDTDIVRALARVYEDGGHLLPTDPQTVDSYIGAYYKCFPDMAKRLLAMGVLEPPTAVKAQIAAASKQPPSNGQKPRKSLIDKSIPGVTVEDSSLLEDLDATLSGVPKKDRPSQKKYPSWWRGTAPKRKCPVTDAKLTHAMRHCVVQGTPLWHLLRRFFVGATRLKCLLRLDSDAPAAHQTTEYGARLLLGLEHDEPFDDYVKEALVHGHLFEDLARIGYECRINGGDLDDQQFKVEEYGMSTAPYLPIFFAQSPDGVVKDIKTGETVGMIEIKCQYMRHMCYDICPPIYIGQCIQGMLAHGVKYCDFVSMWYRCNPGYRYEEPHDPRFVTFTVERLHMNPKLEELFKGYLVAFALFTQMYGACLRYPTAPFSSILRRGTEFVRAHVIRLLPEVHHAIASMKREHLCIEETHEPEPGDDSPPFNVNVPMCAYKMNLLEFVGYDKQEFDRWFAKSVKKPPAHR